VDCVLLTGPDFPRDEAAEAELRDGLPFIEMAIVGPELFQGYLEKVFATDRRAVPKGMMEVLL